MVTTWTDVTTEQTGYSDLSLIDRVSHAFNQSGILFNQEGFAFNGYGYLFSTSWTNIEVEETGWLAQ